MKEHKEQILQELKDELDLLKILYTNKGAANDKLRAWLTKNAPAEPIPVVDPPTLPVVVVPDEPVVVPAGDKPDTNTTNPSDPASTASQNDANGTLPSELAPVPFAYSLDYLSYIS
jgi:hypothetical protein